MNGIDSFATAPMWAEFITFMLIIVALLFGASLIVTCKHAWIRENLPAQSSLSAFPPVDLMLTGIRNREIIWSLRDCLQTIGKPPTFTR